MQSEQHFHRYLAQRHFGSLDGIRFLSIAAVLWHHAPLPFPVSEIPLLGRGFLGVNLFFVLSGFLITTLLLREELRHERISLLGFYWRRLLRIVPAYFLLLAVTCTYYCAIKGESHWAGLVPYYFGFLANFLKDDIPLLAPTWSLAVEEQYYLVWPTLLLLSSGRMSQYRSWILSLLIAALVLHEVGALDALVPDAPETRHAVFSLPGEGYSAILMGSLLALTLHTPSGYQWVYSVCGARWSPCIWGLGLAAFLTVAPGTLKGLPVFLVHMLMAGLLASVVVSEDHAAGRLLQFRPLARIGEISYGLYLFHLVGLHFAQTTCRAMGTSPPNAWVTSLLYVVFSIGIAELSFRYYEAPFLKMKHRLPGSRNAT